MLPGVGEELVQDEGLLTSQQEQRPSETGPLSTDLRARAAINEKVKKKRGCQSVDAQH